MQTFMPLPTFEASLRALDYRRLGKQRVEADQILRTLRARASGEATGWADHPAVLMWEGYEGALSLYRNTAIREWMARGYANNMPLLRVERHPKKPWWMGNSYFHGTHRAMLHRKDPVFYAGWRQDAERWDGYWWPGGAAMDPAQIPGLLRGLAGG